MAEIGQYTNYPTYPGLGPWYNANFEQDLTEDYRINDKNVPSSRAAIKHDIFSSEYEFGAWLGPLIPLPSGVLLGGFPVVLTPITIRGSYNNYLNQGLSTVFSTLDVTDNFGVRPPTFHYQVMDQYKEVVHYGFELILLALGSPIGTIEVTNVVSFIPYLEHRDQSLFEQVLIRDGTVSSIENEGEDGYSLTLSTGGEIPAGEIVIDDGGLNVSVYVAREEDDEVKYETVELPINKIGSTGKFSIPQDSIDSATVDVLPGSYFFLDHAVQIKDPTVYFSERTSGSSEVYWEEDSNGFATREQSTVANANEWTSILYDLEQAEQVVTRVKEDVDGKLESGDIDDTEEIAELQARKKLVDEAHDFISSQDTVAESYGEVERGGEPVSAEFILSMFDELEASTVNLRLPISGGISRNNNFHAGTQQGGYMRIADGDGNLHVFSILRHIRNEIFTLPRASLTSSKTIFEILQDTEASYTFEVYSSKMWTVTDITTGRRGGPSNTASFDRGIFTGNIDFVEAVEETGEGDDDPIVRTQIHYKIDEDRDYYGFDYLTQRYYDDPEPQSGTIKAWKKFDGWRLHERGRERTNSYPIIDSITIGKDNEDFLVLTLDKEYPDLVAYDPEFPETDLEYWIGFAPVIDTQPSTLDYVSTPTLLINAFYGAPQDVNSDATIIFDGTYIGSPVAMDLPDDDATISLVEDNPVIFPNVGPDSTPPLLKVSSSKAFKYISFNEDFRNDSEVILYNRDDDSSSALYARMGRLDYKFNIGEFLVYLGTPDEVDTEVTQTNNVAVFAPPSSDDVDVVGILAVRENLENDLEPDKDNKYKHTIWSVYHGDRNLGYESQSGRENSFYTRAIGSGEVTDAINVGLYHNAEYFSSSDGTDYRIPGNMSTGDPLATGGFRFINIREGDPKNSEFSSAKLQVVPSERVFRNVNSHTMIPHGQGQIIVLTDQPQSGYLPSDASDGDIDSVELVEGTESERESENDIPPVDVVDMAQNGVFMSSTTDFYDSFVSGLFLRPRTGDNATSRSALYSDPLLLSRDITLCDYSMVGGIISVAGFSKIVDDSASELTALVYRSHNVDDIFSKPIFRHKVQDSTAFLTCDTVLYESVVIGNTSDTATKPIFTEADLEVDPVSFASNDKYSIIIFRRSNNFSFLISTNKGKTWSFFDDIQLVDETGRVAAPSVRIHGDWLYMFYFVERVEMKFKRISMTNITRMHRKYMNNQRSSSSTDEATEGVKQELRDFLDNTTSVKVTDSFEQRVSFGINSRNVIHVVYYNADGLVSSAESTTDGEQWDINPVNF